MFVKNDNEFICVNCNQKVEKLKYTSRDHCNHCLYSIHVDITPGDRANDCKGILVPINVIETSKKGDNQEAIYKVVEDYAKGVVR